VAKYIGDAFSASYSISGIPVSPGSYPPAIALFIAGICLMLIGPWLCLRCVKSTARLDPWTLISAASGTIGVGLRVLQNLTYGAIAFLPFIVLATQLPLCKYLHAAEFAVWLAASCASLPATIVLIALLRAVARLRASASA